ncbi:MAG TPA: CYTH domain-containing protein [Xanthobacteraceae bacterium]|nr:CYTH domain-containing protein [Xanthobacteraceae bacterium]
MNFEIERKFLIRGDDWRGLVTARSDIRQAYLEANAKASIRVRIKNNSAATLTIKSRASALRRLELEYPIPIVHAEALIQLRQGIVIEKVRHIVPCGSLSWEIDVFMGDNHGLVIAEIELPNEHHPVELPSWIGTEVTGQGHYYNGPWPCVRFRFGIIERVTPAPIGTAMRPALSDKLSP